MFSISISFKLTTKIEQLKNWPRFNIKNFFSFCKKRVFKLIEIPIIFNIFFRCYRRKTGHWPKPCRKSQRPTTYANPYENKPNGTRRKKVAGESNLVVVGHQTDYRIPTPQNPKKIYSIDDRISNHLQEGSDKLSKNQADTVPKITSSGVSGVTVKMSRSKSYEDNGNISARATALYRSVHSYSGEIGVYQDRTLPATLMMTTESKRQKFANQDLALKRSHSATPRSSANSTSSHNLRLSGRTESNSMQIYNDFGPKARAGQFRAKRNARRPSNLSSLTSSKPSNTSDYISDFDSLSRNDRRNLNSNVRSLSQFDNDCVSECDSVLEESIPGNKDSFTPHKQPLKSGVSRPYVPPLALFQVEADITCRNDVFFEKEQLSSINRLLDDRTESQQNTVRSEAFRNYSFVTDEVRFCADGQNSDTESMVGSACVATSNGNLTTKQRHYVSDNEFLSQHSHRNRTRRKRHHRRSSSNGWESEPSRTTTQPTKKRRHSSQLSQMRNNPKKKENSSLIRTGSKLADPETSNSREKKMDEALKLQNNKLISTDAYKYSSLNAPVTGPLVEMPIYSQNTWSGPKSSQNQISKKSVFQKATGGSMSRVKKLRKGKKGVPAERKLSIGGGGRYFCEFESLTIDQSKLPKDLIEKIGGQTHQLLEPIEQLNFDQLCKPLPHLGKTEGQLSARRLVIDRLPPNHRDREILSNTYEYEDTGLVMTDL